MPHEAESDPNLFRGEYISPDELSGQMLAVIEREEMPLSFKERDVRLDTDCIALSNLSDYDPVITRGHTFQLIRNVMTGRDVGSAFDYATRMCVVQQRGHKHPVGVALLTTNLFGDWHPLRIGHDFSMNPQVSVNAYGLEVGPSGKVNQMVLDSLASSIIHYAAEIADLLYPHFGAVDSKSFQPAVYVNVANFALPTIRAANFQSHLSVLITCLSGIVSGPTGIGTGFSARVESLHEALAALRAKFPDHALVKGMEGAPVWDILHPRRVQGGDEQSYKTAQKAASVLFTFFRSLQRGMHDSFVQLHPESGASPSAKSEVMQGKDGHVSVTMEDRFVRASAHFTPQDHDSPVIRIETDYDETVTSDLVGRLYKEVFAGAWWQQEMAKSV